MKTSNIKRTVSLFFLFFILSTALSSCATIFGGPLTTYQKTVPGPSEPQREIRFVALVADILIFWPSAVIDFANGAIYRPAPTR